MNRALWLILFVLPFAAQAQQVNDTPKYLLPPPPPQVERPVLDSVVMIHRLPLQAEWEEQTTYGSTAKTEKAIAGFYSTGKKAGLYAFYNMAAAGTILKVTNFNNKAVIYVKVLGTVPRTRQLTGCNLALSSSAKAALKARDNKVLCEVSYLGY